VCEVLSASTRRLDLHQKRPLYAREGVGYLWLVDPADAPSKHSNSTKGNGC
jgi:Uma2 family endonuclease